METEQNRFPLQQEMAPLQRRKRWGGCFSGLPCFSAQKNGKRVVPASRMPDTNSSQNAQNRPQNDMLANHATSIVPSLLAPPSSPASFSNSAIPSTVQSPNNFPSIISPGRPSAFTTGPYAHETQLVSPPVFSAFTTEPSTAPLTPPPELAHLTTPSSPDVPFAQIKGMEKNHFINGNDFQESYSPYSGSPSCLEYYSRDSKYSNSDSGRLMGVEATSVYKAQDSNFFCPATFAQFYLDNPPNSGGRLSVSKESDVCSNGYQNRVNNNKSCKQDGDEIEAYRASFGFSADEIVTTPHYVEINDVMDESLTTWSGTNGVQKVEETHVNPQGLEDSSFVLGNSHGAVDNVEGHKPWKQVVNNSVQSTPGNHDPGTKDNIFSWKGSSRGSRKYHQGLSSSDAEIDYRRVRSLRERKANSEWHD